MDDGKEDQTWPTSRWHGLVSSRGGDVGDADDLAGQLRQELHETGFDVGRPAVGAAPPGTKGDALAWAQLAVSFTGGLPALVAAIRTFTRRDETRKVTMTLSDDTLELTGPTSTQQQQLVDAWLRRHSPTPAQPATHKRPGTR